MTRDIREADRRGDWPALLAALKESDNVEYLIHLAKSRDDEELARACALRLIRLGERIEICIDGEMIIIPDLDVKYNNFSEDNFYILHRQAQKILETSLESVIKIMSPFHTSMLWDEKRARLFACECVEKIVPFYNRIYGDMRAKTSLDLAKKYIDNKIGSGEMIKHFNIINEFLVKKYDSHNKVVRCSSYDRYVSMDLRQRREEISVRWAA